MKTRGFSLVELSIVLVILGLLVGGILAGKSLIHAAELRVVTTERDKYWTAMRTFRDKYFAIPGDMANATSIWGTINAAPATCRETASTGTPTCDGDGDGLITAMSTNLSSREMFRFWEHLAKAGLIEGTYPGTRVPAGDGDEAAVGYNAGTSKFLKAGWSIQYDLQKTAGNTTEFFNLGLKGNSMVIGATIVGEPTYGVAFTPEDVWNIDSKIDDGKPAAGNVVAGVWPTCTNAINKDNLTASYLLTSSAIACSIIFPNAI
jgi:prepilin-type N-terminal cleavage/methylation domain-containing protein